MDKKSFLVIILCFIGYLGWEQYLNTKYPQRHKRPVATQTQPNANPNPAGPAEAELSAVAGQSGEPAKPVVTLSRDELTIETLTSRYLFSQQTGGIASLILKNYENDDRSGPFDLVPFPLYVQNTALDVTQAMVPKEFHASREGDRLIFSRRDGPWELQHTIEPDREGYGAHLAFSWKNQSDRPIELNSGVIFMEKVPFKHKSSSFLPGQPSGRPLYLVDVEGKSKWHDIQDYCDGSKDQKDPIVGSMQEVDLLGVDNHYFLKVFLPEAKKVSYRVFVTAREPDVACTVATYASLNQGTIAPGQTVTLSTKAWFGPKETALLTAYDPKLEETVDLGFFSAISRPLLVALKFVYGLVGNWGLAIIIFTILLKILFYPLVKQAAIAQKRLKKLQPEMDRIKERHKDDPRQQQQEIMRFMGAHKINPMKGCLPILPQIPVFFAFFRVLSTSIELRHAPFFAWIQDLSVADPFYITPLILGACMFLQQKLTPTTGMDKTQERIMMMMPLIFSVMMLTLPAGLVLYTLTNSVMSIAQQQWLNKRLD